MSTIKRISLFILLLATAFAQTAAPTPGVASAANAYQSAFNGAYYQSKAPAFATLYNGRPGSPNPSALPLDTTTQWNTCGTLISQGYLVDEEIDCNAMDPYTTMFMRQLYGDTWEPAGAGATQCTATSQPGCVVTPNTGPVPAGAIPVCVLLSCYPPYQAPTAGPAAGAGTLVANPVGGVIFLAGTSPGYIGSEFKDVTGTNGQDGYAYGSVWTGTAQGLTGSWQKISIMMGMATAWIKTN
jgi:hypothetical protein